MKRLVALLLSVFVTLSVASCSRVASPTIKEAEFPFEIVYEIDGETVTVSDVYVCEFDGFAWNENVGRYRQWKGYVKTTGKDHLVLLEDGDLKLACNLGSAAYYMGDPSMAGAEKFTPEIYYVRTFESGGVSSGFTGVDSLLEQYKLKLISWKLSDPIENSFK